MNDKVFPSLSSDGFISDRSILSKKLYEMFLSSDKSQSNFKDAESLKYILNLETVDDYSKNEEIRKSLDRLYSAYFDTVIVSVGNDTTEENVLVFTIKIDCTYNGVAYSLDETLSKDYYVDIDKFDAAMKNI